MVITVAPDNLAYDGMVEKKIGYLYYKDNAFGSSASQ